MGRNYRNLDRFSQVFGERRGDALHEAASDDVNPLCQEYERVSADKKPERIELLRSPARNAAVRKRRPG